MVTISCNQPLNVLTNLPKNKEENKTTTEKCKQRGSGDRGASRVLTELVKSPEAFTKFKET